ncbi:hypothetical protein PoB_000947200 [Plakobranchus ocellatus]|uniref:Uncharacterized protein n=1 Tax=Plakobranchus ocellatus TaxID=259542 RepID=A0AAV3YJB3_9GAST|nr:hypothetical protein PoB_000947200 [Plakobranchus ocellatus]
MTWTNPKVRPQPYQTCPLNTNSKRAPFLVVPYKARDLANEQQTSQGVVGSPGLPKPVVLVSFHSCLLMRLCVRRCVCVPVTRPVSLRATLFSSSSQPFSSPGSYVSSVPPRL